MRSIGAAIGVLGGFVLVAAANWVLLAPLFGEAVPSIELTAAAAVVFLLGCYLVGRGTRLILVGHASTRESIPEADHTMDWITRP